MYLNPFLSIVVPVYNGGYPFIYCLLAIKKSSFKDWELIVVDDKSTDQSTLIAEELGITVLKTSSRLGPGAARNLGTNVAKGEYLCFIDADFEVHNNTLENLANTLKQDSDIDALFGSYEDTPKALNFVAQYKNLFHHYIRQNGSQEASTFWAGCGAVRRSLFLQLGGFDTQRYSRPSIEDIDLGYRIKQAGGKICLAKHVQVKHHKAWNLVGLIKTDVFDRGIPWTKLLLSNKSHRVNDLNLKLNSRVSVLATYGLLASLLLSVYQHKALILSLVLASFIWVVNFDVYRFFYQKRGKRFALQVVLMHWLYYLYGGLASRLEQSSTGAIGWLNQEPQLQKFN